ncbi:MAG: zinc-ribbon domain-containing protein [Planctomycetota bacterium]
MRDPLPQEQFTAIRGFLRIVGPLLVAIGGICVVAGLISFLSDFGQPRIAAGPPTGFILMLVGAPMFVVGLSMTNAGWGDKISRFMGRQHGPAAGMTFNEVAKISEPGIRSVASALRDGTNDGDAKTSTRAIRFCTDCGSPADSDDKFCGSCGHDLAE